MLLEVWTHATHGKLEQPCTQTAKLSAIFFVLCCTAVHQQGALWVFEKPQCPVLFTVYLHLKQESALKKKKKIRFSEFEIKSVTS